MMVLQGFKEIASYLSSKVGPKSPRTCRRYARDKMDPMPVKSGSVTEPVHCDTTDLDRWIERRWRRRAANAP